MLDLKEERRYSRLRKLAQELHIPMPEAFWTLEVFDKDGRLIQRHRQRSHSWTRNAYNHMFSELAAKDASDSTFGAGKLSIKNSAGVIKYGAYPICFTQVSSVDGIVQGYRAAAGEDEWGILVGSGENAESLEDYFLQTQIVEGTGSDQLSHVQSETHAISYSDTTLKNTLIRYFNNNSGGNVDVNEVALGLRGYVADAYNQWINARDKLASTVTIPDTGQLKVTYTVQLTYPS